MISPDQEELTIKVGGQVLGGWLRIRVTRGVELLPSHFDIETTERFPGQLKKVSADPTSPCTIDLSGDLVLTGYVDRYMPMYDKHQHRVRLIGRSKTEDVVDSSVDPSAVGGWFVSAQTVGQYAKKICDQYGITVVLPDGDADIPGGFDKALTIYPGYTAYFLIEEMARSVGMLVWDNEKGDLVISKVGTKRAGSGVTEGVNAERVEVVFGADQRFANYRVLAQGQDQALGHINYDSGPIKDPESGVLRNRLRIIPQEIPDPHQEFSLKRAQWEANRRYGRSRLARVHVVGWRDGTGTLWTPNTICSVQLPTAKVQEDRVIAEVTWMRGEDGTQTILTLMPAKALSVEPFRIAPVVPT